jgi:ParB family chromosome partitioning protein
MKNASDLMARLGGNMRESMGSSKVAETTPPIPALHGGAPAKYAGANRIKDAFAIALDRIIPDPNQPRKEFDREPLEDLAASLKAKGQLQPILVRYDAGSDRWVIIAGERRYRAATIAGMSALTCVEVKGDLTQEDLLEIQLVENAVREGLKPIEQANAYKALIDHRGWTHRQLADSLSIAASSVARALALLELPADVQEKVTTGDLAPSVAYEVAKIEDPEQQREVAALVVENDLSRAEAVEHVRQAMKPRESKAKSRGPKAKPATIKERTIRTPTGKVDVKLKKAGDAVAILETLREAVRQLEGEAEGNEAAAA